MLTITKINSEANQAANPAGAKGYVHYLGEPSTRARQDFDAYARGADSLAPQLPALQAQLTVLRYAGDFTAINGGVWHTNTPDALYILHHSSEIAEPPVRYGQNVGGLRDATLDDLLSRARRSLDDAERGRLYSAAQLRLVELVPAIPVFENQTLIAHNRRLRGALYDTSHNTLVLTGAWIAPDSR